jgi:hypothetical protein
MDIMDRSNRPIETEGGRRAGGGLRGNLLVVARENRRIGLIITIALASTYGALSGFLTPRGPITTAEALVSMVAALAVGIGAGLVMASRWSMVVTPATFLVVFELSRLGTVGPTVDRIELGAFLGIVAFVVGRVMHGVLVIGPMMLGTVYGVALATHLAADAAPGRGRVRSTLGAVVSVAVVGLVFALARPAYTAEILGADGETLPGSIAELVTVSIGGHNQVMMIRGRNVDNPVLLYLTGGPGGTDLGAMRRDAGLEQDFVVVTWDQRGGKCPRDRGGVGLPPALVVEEGTLECRRSNAEAERENQPEGGPVRDAEGAPGAAH